MFRTEVKNLFLACMSILLFSCNGSNTQELEQTVNEVKDGQQVILKKLATMEKAIANISSANKSASNKKQPPKADPNKVYNIEIGDSFTMGPDDAKVTMIEWTDFQ